MELKIESGHLHICNGSLSPVSFGDAETALKPGTHEIHAENIGDTVKIKRFGFISDCLQRSLRGWILSHGNKVRLTVA